MSKKNTTKDPAAVALGRKGGLHGGRAKVPKGFAKMDPKRLAEVAKEGARKRWDAYRAAQLAEIEAAEEPPDDGGL